MGQNNEGQSGKVNSQDNQVSSPNASPEIVVGIGASAGGLEALERVFEGMPAETGMAFVVIQHLSPDFESMMDELLVRKTSMPVLMATDQMTVEADSIYLIPAKKEMIISDGKLLLKDKDPDKGLSLPINQFFKSLARDLSEKSVAIVLSGTGSDGSRGICDVHDAGGLVIVQSEETAKFDGMPKSAMETGMVDLVLPPDEIGEVLNRYVASPNRSALVEESKPVEPSEPGLKKLIRLLRDEYGIDFSVYKQTTVLRRIERRLLMSETQDFEVYVDRVAENADELHALYRDLLIGVTQFFRDSEAFDLLQSEILPEMLKGHPDGEEFRVWVAGCATGEEPYSIAMLLDEMMTPEQRQNVKIFATDVHRASLDAASAGIYNASSLTNVSADRKKRYFTRTGDQFHITKELRQMIVFAEQNVIKDAPFTRLNLISCRNMLIYFQPVIQKKVISLFHFGLRTGGVLMLGPSEGLGDLEDEFKPIDRHWKVFSKRRDVRLQSALKLPLGNSTGTKLIGAANFAPTKSSANELSQAYDELLDKFLPPSVLINRQREVVHVFGDAGNYLKIRRGRTTGDVLELFEGELKTAISGAIQRVSKEAKATAYTGVNLRSDENVRQIRVSVVPILGRDNDMSHMLISFDEIDDAPIREVTELDESEIDLNANSRARIETLEIDLRHTKENLQATIEELEASNEELHATNEELVASSEEMQSTNEELHSVNEELYTVNAEYQRKIGELTEMTDDMSHLLESTDVGVLFLDRDLAIRKFTPRIAKSFSIIERDIGRSFENFTHSIDHDSLVEDIKWVLSTGQPFETDVKDRTGQDYFLRILPYRVALEIEGVVVTLIDVSSLKRAQSDVRERDIRLRGILDNSPAFIFIKDLQGRYLVANDQSESVFGQPSTEIIGKTNDEFLPQHIAERLEESDAHVAQTGETVEVEETIPRQGKGRTYLTVKYPLKDENNRIVAIAGIKTDITARKVAQRKAERAIRERDRFLAMLSHELRNPLAAIKNASKVLSRIETQDSRITAVSDVLNRQSDQLGCILDDLLDISRVIQGKIDLRRSVVDLRDSANDAILAVRSVATAGGIKLTKIVPETPLPIFGDPSRMQQIVVNLLVNAVKYTPKGGAVQISLEEYDNHVVIKVVDNGVGMNAQLVKRVFDPFVQGENTIDRAEGGMGVGLTLVKSLVELHDGSIIAESEGEGKGSTFTVTIPLSQNQVDANDEYANHEVLIPSLNIVIVEDNADSREMLKLALEMDGHKVIAAADGLSGLTAIEVEKPDIAFVDIGLPEIDGYEVAQRLCANNCDQRTLLVALTGFGQISDVDRAKSSGFHLHITKPVDEHQLETTIARAALLRHERTSKVDDA
jgi:two-component system CheB/CheR fusion protein